jgi:hypothetical protein
MTFVIGLAYGILRVPPRRLKALRGRAIRFNLLWRRLWSHL